MVISQGARRFDSGRVPVVYSQKLTVSITRAVCCSVLQRAAACCSVLQCVAVCCSVLQRAAVCFRMMQCVAVWRSVLQWSL